MPIWGYLMLAAFVTLGLVDRFTWRQASRYALILIAVVWLYVFATYGGLR